MKQVELICVTKNNNNKYYRMSENSDGTWTATWGRVGASENTMRYSMSVWDKKYNEKIKKGYKDITELKKEVKVTSFKDIEDKEVLDFLLELKKYSKQALIDNYTVTSEQVTQAQIDKAQKILNDLSYFMSKKTFNRSKIDSYLTELYTTVPRRMNNVKNYLLNGDGDLNKARQILMREQDSIDNMAQAVATQNSSSEESVTLEEALNIEVQRITEEEKELILKSMGENSHRFKRAFRVVNKKTQPKFDEQKNKSFKKWTKLLWHGSRNENWLSILKFGLQIRPTCAVYTGSMFGDAIYLADKCKKSMGYTSLSGSYWARGSNKQAFIALFEVNTGMEYRIKKHESWMYKLTYQKLQELGQFDSVFAEGGVDLINNEYMVYKPEQVTVKYIVEIN